MSYSILEESGETRTIAVAECENFALVLRVARPEYLLDDVEPPMKPFYFNLFKKDEENDGWTYLTWDGVPIENMKDFRKKSKKLCKKKREKGTPRNIFTRLRSSIEYQIGNELDEPHEYFLRTETSKQKKQREKIDGIYEFVEHELGPDATYPEKNQYILERMATILGFPTVLMNDIDHYTQLDRKLTYDEIRDDMENREMMAMSCPVGSNPDMVDWATLKLKELKGQPEA